MKSFLSSVLFGSLLGSAVALHPRHARAHALKARGEDDKCHCAYTTTVTIYGEEPERTPEPEPTTTLTTTPTSTGVATFQQPPPAINQPQAQPAPEQLKPEQPAPAPAAILPVSPGPQKSVDTPSSGGGLGGVNGKPWAITYTQYTVDGGCKDAATILTEMWAIKHKGFTTIRMYGTDCQGLQNIGAAATETGLKMIVGVYIDGSISAASSQVSDIATWGAQGNWGKVVLIVVGNEAINGKSIAAGDLAAFIVSSRGAWQAAGSGSIPVTTSDTVSAFVNNAAVLCPVVDVVACNVQPFFDGKQTPDTVGDFMQTMFKTMEDACPGKGAYYSLETGWPSAGGKNGQSYADPGTQTSAMQAIINSVGAKAIMFDFQNNAWQKGTQWDPYFGCFHIW